MPVFPKLCFVQKSNHPAQLLVMKANIFGTILLSGVLGLNWWKVPEALTVLNATMRQLWAKYQGVPRNLEPLGYVPNNDLKVHAPKEAELQ